MRIVIGDYILNSDHYCFWISKLYQAKKKNGDKGAIREKNITGYHPSWGALIRSFARHGIGDSDATSMRQLMEDVRQIADDAVKLAVAARENDYRKEG